ncbi:hypothetical protein GGR50DRAFT_495198 [Xylaria sp. CBS 124048]|nr:hypothetical protein GGR50DRAFT_495198 [Xylaria sp. CBS 124048]
MATILMDLFLSYKRDGMMNAPDIRELRPVWSQIAREMNASYPQSTGGRRWTGTEIMEMYKDCERRWQQWLIALDYPETALGEDGIMQASKKSWDWLRHRLPDGRWIQIEPLGDMSVYDEVFEKVAETEHYLSDTDDEENDVQPSRKRPFDPNVGNSSDAGNSAPHRAKKILKIERCMKPEAATMDRKSATTSRTAGADDIAAAVMLIEERLTGILENREKIQAFRVLATSPLNAVILRTIKSDEDKVAFLRSLLV